MQTHEGQPQHSDDVFRLSRSIVNGYIDEFKETQRGIGRAIRKEIETLVAGIEKDDLPESIKIADLTPVSLSRPTILNQAKYAPRTNEIFLITRQIAVITDLRETDPFAEHLDPEEARPIYVPIPQEQQVETIVREAEDAEWVRYGESVVEHLESAVRRAQDAKRQ